MTDSTPEIAQQNREILAEIFKKKQAFHRNQADLPIEEKIRILVELQKIELTLRPSLGPDDHRRVWQLS